MTTADIVILIIVLLIVGAIIFRIIYNAVKKDIVWIALLKLVAH